MTADATLDRRAAGGSAPDRAEREVFQRVLDALIREDHLGLASRGRPAGRHHWEVPTDRGRLRVPVRPDGFQHPWRTARPVLVVDAPDGSRRLVDRLDALLDVLAPTGDEQARTGWAVFAAECRAELAARRAAEEARPRVHAQVLSARAAAPTGMAGALLDEVLAAHQDHPVHPTSRCRHGLTTDELRAYAPEHAPVFTLRWSAVPRRAVRRAGTLPPWWPAARHPDELLLPVHPLTARWRGLSLVDGPDLAVRPTLSMRTVALVDDPGTHLKLPLPTATLGAANRRTIAAGTLADGARTQRLVQRIAAAEPAFADRILHADETTHAHTGDEHLAFLLRRYPAGLAGRVVVPVAALAAADPVGGTVAERVAGGDPGPLLGAYLDLLIDWHVHLWLRHGVALEAHQQNIHLVVDPDGPVRLLYKDNDSARVDARHREGFADPRTTVADPGELADLFVTVTLHLAAAAPLLALAERGVAVPAPGEALRPRLLAARDRWADGPGAELFTARVLDAAHLPVKAMVTAGTLLPKQRLGCADVNKYYRRTGPNYLRAPGGPR